MAFEETYGDVVNGSVVSGTYDEINERYARVLQKLLPSGPAWTFEDDSHFYNLLRALSYSFARVAIRGQQLLREFHPSTMFELLSDWERILGLPGDNPSPPTSIDGRRAAVHSLLLGNSDPTPTAFEEVAAALGYDATVYHHFVSPFVAGSGAGDPVASGWQYYWEIVTQRGDNDELLEWMLERLTPLHTTSKVFWTLSDPVQQTSDGPTSESFLDVAYNGSDLWCAVGSNGTIQTSPDGETWTARSAAGGYSGNFTGVAYDTANDLWCAVGQSGEIQTSPDGITWTARAAGGGFGSTFYGVAHDGVGTWCAVGNNGEIQTSPDGITWTSQHTIGGVSTLYAASYGNGIWVAVGYTYSGTFDGKIMFSSDGGTTWADSPPVGSPGMFRSVAFGDGQFVVVGNDTQIQTSSLGTDWVRREVPSDVTSTDDFFYVTYIGDRWMINRTNYTIESWFARRWVYNSLTIPFLSPAYGDGMCVFVGSTGQIYTAEV